MGHPKDAVYVAVLPAYRRACIDALLNQAPAVALFASPEHLDRSVRTAIDPDLYRSVPMYRFAGKMFLQGGPLISLLRVRNLIVDLNPRSLTAWMLLVARSFARGRRTVVWGHLFPRQGSTSPTGFLRRFMVRLSDGVIAYTYSQARDFRNDERSPARPLWVAPNSLYATEDLTVGPPSDRIALLYVGRLEQSKKVDLLVPAFAEARRRGVVGVDAKLIVVGTGAREESMRAMARKLDVDGSTIFVGEVYEVDELRAIYGTSFASLSPGFAGLGLTQSLGFGVPQIINKHEMHSPEIELAEAGGVIWFDADSPRDLPTAMGLAYDQRARIPNVSAVQLIAKTYSAERMARGLLAALQGVPDEA